MKRHAAAPAPAVTAALAALLLAGCSAGADDPPTAAAPAASSPAAAAATGLPAALPTADSAETDPGPENADGITYALVTATTDDGAVTYDKVDHRPGPCAARTESQFGDPVETLRICFSNVNPRLRTVRLSPDVVFGTRSTDGQVDEQDVGTTYREFRESLRVDAGPQLPFALTIENGIATRIDVLPLLAG